MTLVHITAKQIALVVTSLPLVAMFLCVIISATVNGGQSTRTHCNVANVLPSISAAIGDYTPERYIWRVLIALHSMPRFLGARMYYKYYVTRISKPATAVYFAQPAIYILHCAENFALLGMSYVSSSENFNFHEAMFVVFISSSLAYMILSLYLSRIVIRTSYSRPAEHAKTAFMYKKYAFIANVLCFLLALYFYWRHNAYCEPYMYSLFALCEYLVVVSNMAFHFTFYWDFAEHGLYVTDYDVSKHS